MTKSKFFKMLVDYIGISIGCIVMAISFNSFFVPNKIAPGGFSGLATVIYHFTGFPIGVVTLIMTVPLFIIYIKLLGPDFGMKTFYGTAFLSISIDFLAKTPVVTNDIFLASLFGGIIMGIGIGIIFRFGGTTGGTDLLAAIVYHFIKHISIATWLLVIDFIVVVIAGIAFKNVEITLYSILTIYITMRLIDIIQEGFTSTKAFYIISDRNDEIAQRIIVDLDRGATKLHATGMYSNKEKNVLLCVVNRSQVYSIKELVRSIDPRAFVILADVHEVLGEGFKNINN